MFIIAAVVVVVVGGAAVRCLRLMADIFTILFQLYAAPLSLTSSIKIRFCCTLRAEKIICMRLDGAHSVL
jgi:hypothetical protein